MDKKTPEPNVIAFNNTVIGCDTFLSIPEGMTAAVHDNHFQCVQTVLEVRTRAKPGMGAEVLRDMATGVAAAVVAKAAGL